MKKPKKEITYDQAAELLRCSPRNVRRILQRHGVQPIRRGHRTVTLAAEKIAALVIQLIPANGRKHVTR